MVVGNFQNGRLGRQLWMKTRTERQQLTRQKLTKYQCHTALLVIRLLRTISSEADSKMEGFSKCHGDWMHAKVTFLDLSASSIHGSEKCVDKKTVLGLFGLSPWKNNVLQILDPTALGRCALHTLHTLLLHHWHMWDTFTMTWPFEWTITPVVEPSDSFSLT